MTNVCLKQFEMEVISQNSVMPPPEEEILPGSLSEDLVEGYSDVEEHPSETLANEPLKMEEHPSETKTNLLPSNFIDLTGIPDDDVQLPYIPYLIEHSDTDIESNPKTKKKKRSRDECDSGSAKQCLVNPSTYYNFSRIQRKRLKEIFPNKSFKEIGDMIYLIWKNISIDERRQYETKPKQKE